MSFIWSPCPIDFTSISHLSCFFNESPTLPAPKVETSNQTAVEVLSEEETAKRAAEEAAKRAQEEADRRELIRYAARAGFAALGAAFAICYNYHSIPPLDLWSIAPLQLEPELDLGICPADLDVCEANFDVCPTNITYTVPCENIPTIIPFEVVSEARAGNVSSITPALQEICLPDTAPEIPPQPLAVYYPLPDYSTIEVHEQMPIASTSTTQNVNTVVPEFLPRPIMPIQKDMSVRDPVIDSSEHQQEQTETFKSKYGGWYVTASVIMGVVNYIWDIARSNPMHEEKPQTRTVSAPLMQQEYTTPSPEEASALGERASTIAIPPSSPTKNVMPGQPQTQWVHGTVKRLVGRASTEIALTRSAAEKQDDPKYPPVRQVLSAQEKIKELPLPIIAITPASSEKRADPKRPPLKPVPSNKFVPEKQPLDKPRDNPPPKDVPLSSSRTVSSQPPKRAGKQQNPLPKKTTQSVRPFIKVAEKTAKTFPAAPQQTPWNKKPITNPPVQLDFKAYPTIQEAFAPKPKETPELQNLLKDESSEEDESTDILDFNRRPDEELPNRQPLPQITITPSSQEKIVDSKQPTANPVPPKQFVPKKQPMANPKDIPCLKATPLPSSSVVSSQPPKIPAKQQLTIPKHSTQSKQPVVKLADEVAKKHLVAPPRTPWQKMPVAPHVLDSKEYPTLQEAYKPKPKNAPKSKTTSQALQSPSTWALSPIPVKRPIAPVPIRSNSPDEIQSSDESEDQSTDSLELKWKSLDPEGSYGEPATKGKFLAAKKKLIEELLEESGNESYALDYLAKIEKLAEELDSTFQSGYSSTGATGDESILPKSFSLSSPYPKTKINLPLSPLQKLLRPSPKRSPQIRSPRSIALSPLRQVAMRNSNREKSSFVAFAEAYNAVAHHVPKLQQNKELKEKLVFLTEVLEAAPYETMLTETTYEMIGNFLRDLDTLITDPKTVSALPTPNASLITSVSTSAIVLSPTCCSPSSNPFRIPKIEADSPHPEIEMSSMLSVDGSSLQIDQIEIKLSLYIARIDQMIETLVLQVEDFNDKMKDQAVINALNDEVRLIYNPYIVVVRD